MAKITVLKEKVKEVIERYMDLKTEVKGRLHVVDDRTLHNILERDDPRLVTDAVLEVVEDRTGIPKNLLTKRVKIESKIKNEKPCVKNLSRAS